MAKRINIVKLNQAIISEFDKEYRLFTAETLFNRITSNVSRYLTEQLSQEKDAEKKRNLIQLRAGLFGDPNADTEGSVTKQKKDNRDSRKKQEFEKTLCPNGGYPVLKDGKSCTFEEAYKIKVDEGDTAPFKAICESWLKAHGIEDTKGINSFINAFGIKKTSGSTFLKSGKRTEAFSEKKLNDLWIGYIQDLLIERGSISVISDNEGKTSFIKNKSVSVQNGNMTISELWAACQDFCEETEETDETK